MHAKALAFELLVSRLMSSKTKNILILKSADNHTHEKKIVWKSLERQKHPPLEFFRRYVTFFKIFSIEVMIFRLFRFLAGTT